jgi:hypothetical protein
LQNSENGRFSRRKIPPSVQGVYNRLHTAGVFTTLELKLLSFFRFQRSGSGHILRSAKNQQHYLRRQNSRPPVSLE